MFFARFWTELKVEGIYNALSEMGREKFKPLIEEYSLLKTLPKKELLNPSEQIKLYGNNAYGDEE